MAIDGIAGAHLGTKHVLEAEVPSESKPGFQMQRGQGWLPGGEGPVSHRAAVPEVLPKPPGVESLADGHVLGADQTSWAVFGKGGDKGLVVWMPGGYGRVVEWGQDPSSLAREHAIGDWASRMAEQGYEVLVYNRATGHDGHINDARTDFGSDADARDLERLLSDLESRGEVSSMSRLYLVGHSWGGRAAMAFAAAYPQRVRGATILDMGPFDYGEGSGARRADFEAALAGREYAELNKVFFVGELGQPSYRERSFGTREDLVHAVYRVLHNGAGLPADVAAERAEEFVGWNGYEGAQGWKVDTRPWIDGLMDYTKAREDLSAHLDAVTNAVPVTLLKADTNSGDAVVTNDDVPRLRYAAPNINVQTLEGAEHNLWEADPDAFFNATSNLVNDAMSQTSTRRMGTSGASLLKSRSWGGTKQ